MAMDSGDPRARSRAQSWIADAKEDAKHRATRELRTVADTLRGREVPETVDSRLGSYVGRVASQVDRAVGFLESRTVDDLTRELERFARRRPALFLGGCVALGVLAARFMKSSRPGERWQRLSAPVGYGSPAPYRRPPESRDTSEPASRTGVMGDSTAYGGAMYSGPMRGTRSTLSDLVDNMPDAYGDDFDAY